MHTNLNTKLTINSYQIITAKESKIMTLEVFYDKEGKPKSVLLSYDEYLELIKKFDQDTESPIERKVSNAKVVTNNISIVEESDDIVDERNYREATGCYSDLGGFSVFKGSLASGYHASTFPHQKLFDQLVKEKILVQEDKKLSDYTFTKDYRFNSSSAAACIVSGSSRSGPDAWGASIRVRR